MIEPYVRPEFEEFSGSINFRLVYDAIGEALREIDRQLEAVGPVAFEIAMKSRGYVKERTCDPNTFLADAGENWELWVTECGECGAVLYETYTSKVRFLPNYCPCCGARVIKV